MLIQIVSNEANVTDAIIVCNQAGDGFNRTPIMFEAVQEAAKDGLTVLDLTAHHIVRAMTNIAKQKTLLN